MHITTNKTASKILYPLIKFSEYLGIHHPVFLIKLRYFVRFGRLPNLKNPKDLNEKILYLKLYTDTKEWTRLADKYRVREYIKDCGLEDILVPLYGVWNKSSDISLSNLPKSFILKANNGDGKGSFLVVKDKESANLEEIKQRSEKWLSERNIGALAAEPQYRDIPPRVLAEKLLESNSGGLVDYKIWCFNGRPHSILTCSDRSNNSVALGAYDLNWNRLEDALIPSKDYPAGGLLPRPDNLTEMIEIAEKLSKPFPEVRVDLYDVDGRVYFGELTFTSLGGMMLYYTPKALQDMGSQVNLNYPNI